MWTITDSASGLTNRVTMPSDGIISIVKPKGAKIHAFINDKAEPLHHLHVKAGDVVHFEAHNKSSTPIKAALEFGGETSYLNIAAGAAEYEKDHKMTEAVNLFATPNSGMGGAIGGGMGAGLLGGILGGALLNNGGLFGNNRGVTPTEVQQTVGNNSIMQTLGDIKASIPLAEGQVQIALAGTQAALSGHVQASTDATNAKLDTMNASNTTAFSNLHNNVVSSGAATLAAVLAAEKSTTANSWALSQTITNDGEKTRALIQSIDKNNDSRRITELANEVSELRNEQRLNQATGNITISNNNTAAANAQQQQAQQQFQILANLNAQLQSLNNDIQSIRQSSVVFNSGNMRESGNQAAANTRVA